MEAGPAVFELLHIDIVETCQRLAIELALFKLLEQNVASVFIESVDCFGTQIRGRIVLLTWFREVSGHFLNFAQFFIQK